jgi:hypothetical protein
MYLASAYPNSELTALTMMVIGFVVAASLAAWLGLVFLADRDPRGRRSRAGQAGEPQQPGTTDNEDGELAEGRSTSQHGAAA